MINTILHCLRHTHGVDDYKLIEKTIESCELFYVKKQLQTNRASKVIEYEATVYYDSHGKRGLSKFMIDPCMTKDEIEKRISIAVEQATLALNDYYRLPRNKDIKLEENTSNLKGKDLNEVMLDIVPAIFRADCYQNGQINATEIFLYKTTTRIVNSRKVDVTYESYKGNIEIIPSFDINNESFEVYKMISFSSLDTKDITKQVNDSMCQGIDRSNAVKYEGNKNINVLLHGEHIERLMRYFIYDLSYAQKYYGTNKFNVNDNISVDCLGDKISLTLLPVLSSSSDSNQVDNDGIILKETKLIENNIVLRNHGDFRFGYYLKEQDVTGKISNIKLEKGSYNIDELRKDSYIECVQFSDIQMDPYTGFFGGEVRLGYYYDGNKKVPVTGFSITGNIHDIVSDLKLSNDEIKTGHYYGPSLLLTKQFKVY